MTELSRPFADGGGDGNAFSDAQWQEVLNAFVFRNGVNAGHDNELAVQATAPVSKNIEVQTGSAFVEGIFYITDAVVTKTISDNTSGQPRIDLVVLRTIYADREMRVYVIEGTPAAIPVAPSPTQVDGTTWDEPLAEVEVANGFATLSDGDITDRRSWANLLANQSLKNNSGAPIAAGGVVKVDTTADRAVDTTTTESDGCVIDAAQFAGANLENLVLPMHAYAVLESDAAVTRGDYLASSTTVGLVTPAASGAFAIALETTTGAGPVKTLLLNKPIPVFERIIRDNGADYTTASPVFVDVDAVNLAITLVTRGAPVEIYLSGELAASGGTALDVCLDVDIDGTRYGNGFANGIWCGNAGVAGKNNFKRAFTAIGLAAGSHTFKLQWKTASNTAIMMSGAASLDDVPVLFGAKEL